MEVERQFRFPKGQPIYEVVRGCTVHGEGNLAAVAEDLRKYLSPATEAQIEAWLAELSVITARKPGDTFEEALRLRAYTNRLASYPADVARYATLEHSWKFWPAWAELKEVCDRKAAPRRCMLEAVQKGGGQ